MIKPEHVRAAWQSAVGRDIKFPSVDFDVYVATFLSGIRDVTIVEKSAQK